MKEFKAQLKSKVKHMEKVALIVTFPDSPAELPKEVYDCAYHKDAPNTRSETWRAGIGSAELPARSTHQKVRGSNPTATQGGQQNLTPQDMMGMMMTFANAIAGNAASSNMNVGQLSGLRVFGNARQQKALQDAQCHFGAASSQLALPAPRTTSEPAKSPREPARSPTEPGDTCMESQDGETPPRMFTTEAPSRTPEETVDLMDKSFKARKVEKQKAERAATAEEGPALKRPAAAQSKAKAKAKAKAKSKAQAKPKAKAKANTKQKASEKAAEDDAEPEPSKPSPKKGTSKAVKKDAAGTKPDPPDPWVGTFFWNGGKIHRNVAQSQWRVFIDAKDRNDKKIKWHDDEVGAFHKALDVIDQGRKDRKDSRDKFYAEAAQSTEPLNVD